MNTRETESPFGICPRGNNTFAVTVSAWGMPIFGNDLTEQEANRMKLELERLFMQLRLDRINAKLASEGKAP